MGNFAENINLGKCVLPPAGWWRWSAGHLPAFLHLRPALKLSAMQILKGKYTKAYEK